MDLTLVGSGDQAYLSGPPGQPLMLKPDDVTDVLSVCFSEGTQRLLLYAANLPPRFVDLSSGEAGAVLQKLQNYRIRTAFVIDLAHTPHSRFFADMVAEANRGREFHYSAEPADAVRWLLAEGRQPHE